MLDHLLITRNLLAHYRDSEIHNEIGGRMDFPTLSCRTSPTRSRSASRPSFDTYAGHRAAIAFHSALSRKFAIPSLPVNRAALSRAKYGDDFRSHGRPRASGTRAEHVTTTLWRAREIITERIRASSSAAAVVLARKSGMTPSSAPTTATQSNCWPLPTRPLSRWIPGALRSPKRSRRTVGQLRARFGAARRATPEPAAASRTVLEPTNSRQRPATSD